MTACGAAQARQGRRAGNGRQRLRASRQGTGVRRQGLCWRTGVRRQAAGAVKRGAVGRGVGFTTGRSDTLRGHRALPRLAGCAWRAARHSTTPWGGGAHRKWACCWARGAAIQGALRDAAKSGGPSSDDSRSDSAALLLSSAAVRPQRARGRGRGRSCIAGSRATVCEVRGPGGLAKAARPRPD